MPTLPVHIGDVVQLGAQKQVIWSNAEPIIAAVKNLHPIGDNSKVKYPRRPMGIYLGILRSNANASVSTGHSASGPQPAAFRLDDLIPKSFRKTLGKALRQVGVLLESLSRIHISLPACATNAAGCSFLAKGTL